MEESLAFGVFLHRHDSIYDDSPTERYQFPSQYLGRAKAVVGDWIVYLEPRKVHATRGYFAIAKIQHVIPDPGSQDMFLAVVEPGSYLDFAIPVPFRDQAGLVETGLLNASGRLSGRAQSAVRPLSSADFNRILDRGLNSASQPLPRIAETFHGPGMYEQPEPFAFEQQRDRTSIITSRTVRSPIFRQAILRAYDSTCAVTGLRLINGGGRAEVEAAHIRPVEANGPDSVSNGLALSGTAHWMFDRGLIGITDDLKILISRHVNDAEAISAVINRNGRILPTSCAADRPHPHFLQWHRENCFKA
jgi:putative restriction endonuclease